ncbi:hypothetical protein KJ660_02475 [Candidatus Micrarchaeota archaeon]|nr:hypothetical protein [Candidatus Micrarchaeota archaeon]
MKEKGFYGYIFTFLALAVIAMVIIFVRSNISSEESLIEKDLFKETTMRWENSRLVYDRVATDVAGDFVYEKTCLLGENPKDFIGEESNFKPKAMAYFREVLLDSNKLCGYRSEDFVVSISDITPNLVGDFNSVDLNIDVNLVCSFSELIGSKSFWVNYEKKAVFEKRVDYNYNADFDPPGPIECRIHVIDLQTNYNTELNDYNRWKEFNP